MNDLVQFFTGGGNYSTLEITVRVFFTITIVLVLLWIIPMTRSVAISLLGHKYRLSWLFVASFLKSIYTHHKTIAIHLFKSKETIFMDLERELAKEEDMLRGR